MSVDVLLFRLAIITINANHQSDGTDCQSVHYGLRVRSLRTYDSLTLAYPLKRISLSVVTSRFLSNTRVKGEVRGE